MGGCPVQNSSAPVTKELPQGRLCFGREGSFGPCHRPLGVTCAAPVNTLSTLLKGFQTSLHRAFCLSDEKCKRLHPSSLRALHKKGEEVKCVEIFTRLKALAYDSGPLVGQVTVASQEWFSIPFWCLLRLVPAHLVRASCPGILFGWRLNVSFVTLFQPPHSAKRRGPGVSRLARRQSRPS